MTLIEQPASSFQRKKIKN
jgi:hypothetical protein